MAKLLYSVTMSVDGFIAGAGGDMSWLTRYLGPNPNWTSSSTRSVALLVGNRTFGGDDPHRGTEAEGKPFGGGWDGPQFVLTHHAPTSRYPASRSSATSTPRVAAAKAAAGDKYVNVLGARSPASASTPGCSTRSSCSSRRSCSATACVCSNIRAAPTSSSNA